MDESKASSPVNAEECVVLMGRHTVEGGVRLHHPTHRKEEFDDVRRQRQVVLDDDDEVEGRPVMGESLYDEGSGGVAEEEVEEEVVVAREADAEVAGVLPSAAVDLRRHHRHPVRGGHLLDLRAGLSAPSTLHVLEHEDGGREGAPLDEHPQLRAQLSRPLRLTSHWNGEGNALLRVERVDGRQQHLSGRRDGKPSGPPSPPPPPSPPLHLHLLPHSVEWQ